MKNGLFCIWDGQRVQVPLKKVSLQVKVVDFVAQVSFVQDFVNSSANPIAVEYSYPVEESAAIVGFEATIGDHEIIAEVKEKEQAKAEYNQAMRDRNSAIILDESSPDIFMMKLGQLKPGAGAQVRLTYIMELPVEEKSTRLTIPTTIAPRYIPSNDNTSTARDISNIFYKNGGFDFSKPHMELNIEAIMKGKIKSITSPTHEIESEIEPTQDQLGQFKAQTKLKGCISEVMNRDIVVLFKVEDNDKPMVFVEENEGSTAAMVSLIPSFKLQTQKCELIFLVDRSGSMSGRSMNLAKEALQLFLHSLPVDCYFNIVSFGSRFSSLFFLSKLYDDHTLAEAKHHVDGMDANFGGTEVYNPLKSILDQAPIKGYARQVFLLTDGAVSNSTQVIQLVKKNSNKTRVFTLGLGSSASRHLVKGVARAGKGLALHSSLLNGRFSVLSILSQFSL